MDAHDVSEDDSLPGHHAGPAEEPTGPPAYASNFELIYRMRMRLGEQYGEIFNLACQLARLTGAQSPAAPRYTAASASQPGTIEGQREEIAALVTALRENETMIKRLHAAIARKQGERGR